MANSTRLWNPRFPKSNAYHPDWVIESASGGANAIWLTEWLSSALQLQPGMNILDLGCGRATSSIFLAREFGARVWAADLWFNPSENQRRIIDAGLEGQVYPIHVEARNLPFAEGFFDAIVSIDAFPYFGTDDHYLNNLLRFVKPGGILAIAQAGFVDELDEQVPPHLQAWIDAEPALLSMHSSRWWRRHWEQTRLVETETCDCLHDGWEHWLAWLKEIAPDNQLEINSIEADRGRNLTYNRVIARRRQDVEIGPPLTSLPSNYARQTLLRASNQDVLKP